jgi:hypothetical protein
MSISTQQKILQTVGIAIVTMLVLSVAQGVAQITNLFDLNHLVLVLFVLFPILAVLNGAAVRFMIKNGWAAFATSALAFLVVILVLFNNTGLIYLPGYVLLSLLGYATAGSIKQRK